MRLPLALTTLALAVCAAPSTLAASPPPTVVYAGQGKGPTFFYVTLARHDRALRIDLAFQAPCGIPGVVESLSYRTGDPPAEMPLRLTAKNGFNDVRHFVIGNGGMLDLAFSGRVGRQAAYGTFSVRIKPLEAVGTCVAGPVQWSAARR